MEIQSIRIENFRGFKDETISFDNYTCFVGANGSGKSTILEALNVFFRQYKDTSTDLSKLKEEDFHHKNTDDPIRITVTFSNLSEQAENDLDDYVRQGKLIVTAEADFNEKTGDAEVTQYGSRLGFDDFRKYFKADNSGAKAEKLKNIYQNLRSKYPDLPDVWVKADMEKALHEYEENHPEECISIPSQDEFYGFTRGKNKLDPHIQWVYVPASKDLTEESEESRNSVLGQLLERTVRSKVNFDEKTSELRQSLQEDYQDMLEAEQDVLSEISNSLETKLKSWSHPDVSAQVLWKNDPEKSVKVDEPWAYIQLGERGFEGELARFGHGLQRSYMLALLQELSDIEDEEAPKLIMGIEEPEIYQHPPQIRYLSEVLYELSKKGSQIMMCSHEPLFIPGDNFEAVRVVREKQNSKSSYVTRITYDDLASELNNAGQKLLKEKGVLAKLYPILNPVINEMFFCQNLILVEGIEDVAYVMTYLMLNDKLKDFRKNGCHIVPVGGKNRIIKPLCIANLLEIPTYVICDADTNKTREDEIIKHKKDNEAILNLLGYEDEDKWPTNTISKKNLTMWKTNLTDIVSEELGEDWNTYLEDSYNYYGQPGGLKKNRLAISRALKNAWDEDVKSSELRSLADQIIKFSNQ